MNYLTGAQKRRLRSAAHNLKPVVMIGQKGVTDSLIQAVSTALEDHELIKIKFTDLKDEKRELTGMVCSNTNSSLVGIIGNIAILYRESSKISEKDRIRLA